MRFHDRLAYSEAQLTLERHARAQAEKSLADAHTSLCRLVQQQEHVRENERNRIARDIHDDLGQHMLALKIELSLLQVSTSGAHPLVHQKVGALLGNLDQAIAALRVVIKDLRPLALEHGLQTAMQAHLAEFTRLNGIRHELDAEPAAFHPGGEAGVDAMLFRILQESLANVARHAQATEVKIALVRSGDLLTMNVRDNGIGMAGHPATQRLRPGRHRRPRHRRRRQVPHRQQAGRRHPAVVVDPLVAAGERALVLLSVFSCLMSII